ncbi:histidine kinase [Bacillus coahuilensis p1.1.43]|uniref:histidine kinase n=1 Tax=Bacillus coahuilensis p1.1.43 TaxID=1150625 RepID=A0A147K417_9BACI|nr:sensor histidine kinase [Bacillus coahuilensis]KUP04036.1 histidine kinase [Bacillus coahuilensis p1.1.43]
MIQTFLIERKSWILLFILLQSLFLFVAFIDPNTEVTSILYTIYLSTIIFLLFLSVRYFRETSFIKSISHQQEELDVSQLGVPHSQFDHIIHTILLEHASALKNSTVKSRAMVQQEKDELLAWIHEVKTPLTALHLIMERIEDPTLRSQLTYEWLRIHLLLDQQLHQKRIQFIENDVYMEKVELESLLIGEIKVLKTWCIQKGIGISLDLQVDTVTSEKKWLAFIVRQLLTNAVKYSDGGEVTIKSYWEGDNVLLEITDEGCGIHSKDVPRIFDKGFTSTTNTARGGATGMGLYLTKKAADSLHIQLHVQTTPGRGTTFTLTFPEPNEMVRISGM